MIEKINGLFLRHLLRDHRAIETTEVALIIGVVVLVAYGAYQVLGVNIRDIVLDVANGI